MAPFTPFFSILFLSLVIYFFWGNTRKKINVSINHFLFFSLFVLVYRADILCRFFLLWSPQVYGELGDSEAVARRGFELITSDLEWEEPSPQHQRRLKPAKKGRGRKDDAAAVAAAADEDDDDDPLGATAELAKESWEVKKNPQPISSYSSLFL